MYCRDTNSTLLNAAEKLLPGWSQTMSKTDIQVMYVVSLAEDGLSSNSVAVDPSPPGRITNKTTSAEGTCRFQKVQGSLVLIAGSGSRVTSILFLLSSHGGVQLWSWDHRSYIDAF